MRGGHKSPAHCFLHRKIAYPGRKEDQMGLLELLLGVIGLALIGLLAYLADNHSKNGKYEEDEAELPLLGVVLPKKQEKEDK